MRLFRIRRSATILTASLLLTTACSTHRIQQNPQTGRINLQQSYNAFSPQQDIQLGQQAAQEVRQQLPLLPENSPVTQYIQKLGQQLASKAPGTKYPYSFHVVNQKEINAFALPGGPVYVNLGTIQAADTEGELAGVMAHEIAHVALRHATSNASKEQMAQIPLAILGGILGNGTTGQLARLGISLGANSVFLKYSRDAETEADELGSQIMYDAGYDPYEMVEFFGKLEKQGGSGGPQFLSDHPNPGNRQKDVSAVVSKFPKRNYRNQSQADFERIKQIVKNMKPMSAQEIAQYQQKQQATMQRAAEAQIRPSGQFQTLNQDLFTLQYPSNWKVFGGQNSGVTIAPEAGVSQNAIAYGVVVSGFRPQPGRDSLDIATRDLVNSIVQSNSGMQAQNARQISVSGRPAMIVNMVGPSPLVDQSGQRIPEQDSVVTIQRQDGSILFLVFVAPQPDMQVLSQTYQQMLQTMQVH